MEECAAGDAGKEVLCASGESDDLMGENRPQDEDQVVVIDFFVDIDRHRFFEQSAGNGFHLCPRTALRCGGRIPAGPSGGKKNRNGRTSPLCLSGLSRRVPGSSLPGESDGCRAATMKSSFAAFSPITSLTRRTIIGNGQVLVPSGVKTRTRLFSYNPAGVPASMISLIFASERVMTVHPFASSHLPLTCNKFILRPGRSSQVVSWHYKSPWRYRHVRLL